MGWCYFKEDDRSATGFSRGPRFLFFFLKSLYFNDIEPQKSADKTSRVINIFYSFLGVDDAYCPIETVNSLLRIVLYAI